MVVILNTIIKGFSSIVGVILLLLPDSPFTWDLGGMETLLGVVNYFIPFQSMVVMLTTYTVAVALWYAIRWILRFTRYIQ